MTRHPPEKRIKRSNHETTNGAENTIPIPHLPDEIIEQIISFLPIKHAANLSILSTRFKNSGRYSRYLRFDKDFARDQDTRTRVEMIGNILDLHLGKKIYEFSVSITAIGLEDFFVDLIKKVTSKHVEELDLDFCRKHLMFFYLRSDLFDVESIKILKLSYCALFIPKQFKGLCFLKTLVLQEIYHGLPEFIPELFSNCSVIEVLELVNCKWLRSLVVKSQSLKNFKVSPAKGFESFDLSPIDIDAPNLHSFHYHGDFRKIKFHCEMVLLDDVILNFTPMRNFRRLCGMEDFMTSLAAVNVLKVTGAFLEVLSPILMNGKLEEQRFWLPHLKEFHLCGMSFVSLFDLASFLKNCPCLKRLFIDLGDFSLGKSAYWEYAGSFFEQYEPLFQSLKFIKLKGLKHDSLVLEMVKFFLRKARILETIVMVSAKKSQRSYFDNVLIGDDSFLPASPVARIEVYSYLEDESCMHLTGNKDFRLRN